MLEPVRGNNAWCKKPGFTFRWLFTKIVASAGSSFSAVDTCAVSPVLVASRMSCANNPEEKEVISRNEISNVLGMCVVRQESCDKGLNGITKKGPMTLTPALIVICIK